MAQHDYNLANNPGSVFRADANDALEAVATNNSGATEPTTTFPHQWWFSTATLDLSQRNGANTAWVKVARKTSTGWRSYLKGSLFPDVQGSDILTGGPGTRALFQQTNAPIGWSKETVHNNKALRLVTGSVGTGGTNSFSTIFGSGKSTLGHTLTASQSGVGNHAHGPGSYQANLSNNDTGNVRAFANRGADQGGSNAPLSGTSGFEDAAASSSHSHNLTMDLQFVDHIIAIKS